MIKHSREVSDPVRFFRNAQEQIVILRPIKLAAKFDARQIAPHDHEMSQVIVRSKKFRRPIRFQEWRRQFPIDDFVFVGINHIRFAIVLQKFNRPKQRVRLQQIVVIEQRDPVTARPRQPRV